MVGGGEAPGLGPRLQPWPLAWATEEPGMREIQGLVCVRGPQTDVQLCCAQRIHSDPVPGSRDLGLRFQNPEPGAKLIAGEALRHSSRMMSPIRDKLGMRLVENCPLTPKAW